MKLGEEYRYDANGNLTQDKNKGITGIAYNHLNLPERVSFSATDYLEFRYAASGQEVAKLVYQTGQPVQRTDYLGPYQYEGDSLRFFPHAEGRVLRFVRYDAARQPTARYEREFTVKDHLGNLRLAYRAGRRAAYTATLNQDDAPTHEREARFFDPASVSAPVAQRVGASLAYSDQYVALLNAAPHSAPAGAVGPAPLGPLARLAVQQGDVVVVQAHGLYPRPVASSGFLFSLGAFVATLLQPAPPAPTAPGDGRERAALPLLQLGVAAGLTTLPQLGGGVPKGYLRLLVFDADNRLIDQQVQPLTPAALNSYEPLRLEVTAPQDGAVLAYVGNESDADVYFDDVTVEHRPGLQVQETHYDPAGLELAGLDYRSPGLQALNQYKFNGQEYSTLLF